VCIKDRNVNKSPTKMTKALEKQKIAFIWNILWLIYCKW